MLDQLLNSTTVPLLQQLAEFSERRHEVLAGNVANIDTPHYRRKDLPVGEFQAALKNAVSARQNSTISRYADPAKPTNVYFDKALHVAQAAEPSNALFQDGAERSIESDVLAMTKNLLKQNFAIELMTSQMNMLAAVIQERA